MTSKHQSGSCIAVEPQRCAALPSSRVATWGEWRARTVRPGFNLQMAYAGAAALLVSFLGCRLTHIQVKAVGGLALGATLIAVIALPIALYLHEKRKQYLQESLLTVLWGIFWAEILGFPVAIAARLGIARPLQDANLLRWDQAVGIYVPKLVAWAPHHWLGIVSNMSYAWVFPLMQAAIFLPILAGELKYAQRFLLANLVAFVAGLPVFAMFPAIGPWYGFHLPVQPYQTACQALIFLIRQPGPFIYQFPSGAICFPSYHVIWALLGVQALWWMRPVRVLLVILAALILFSTMTVGNHYFVDVLAGIPVAAVAMYAADRLMNWAPIKPGLGDVSSTEKIAGVAR